MDDFSGYLQTDGYAGYNAVCQQNDATSVGCWDHARRKFKEAQTAQPKKKNNQKPTKADVALVASTTLGGRVLAQTHGVNFQNLFDTFNDTTNAFIWDPSARSSYTVTCALEALDGTRTSVFSYVSRS